MPSCGGTGPMLDEEAVFLIAARFIREIERRLNGRIAARQLGEAFANPSDPRPEWVTARRVERLEGGGRTDDRN